MWYSVNKNKLHIKSYQYYNKDTSIAILNLEALIAKKGIILKLRFNSDFLSNLVKPNIHVWPANSINYGKL
jgi:hypothetical protein